MNERPAIPAQKPAPAARAPQAKRPFSGREGAAARVPGLRPLAPIVPNANVAGQALIFVIAIMSFLACLTIGAVSMIRTTANGWASQISREITIQIKPDETIDMEKKLVEARELALSLGAASAQGADDRPPVPLDSAILFAPVGDLVAPALEALDRGGTLAIAGIHLSDVGPLNYQRHLFQERQVRSVTSNTRADARRCGS